MDNVLFKEMKWNSSWRCPLLWEGENYTSMLLELLNVKMFLKKEKCGGQGKNGHWALSREICPLKFN